MKVLHEGKNISAKQIVAQNLWSALLTGVIKLDDGNKVLPIASAEEYMALVKFLHSQIDGPPPAAMAVDMTTQGQPIGFTMVEVVKLRRARADELDDLDDTESIEG